jgi:uncharacterized membrane protein
VKPKLLIGILVVLIALNLATIGSFVVMQWKRGDREYISRIPPGPRFPSEKILGEPPDTHHAGQFRLTRENRMQLRQLLTDFQEDTAELRAQVHGMEVDAFALMERDPVPRSELDSVLAEISAARLAIRRMAVDKLIESKTHLSPLQQKHFYRAILQTHTGRGMGLGPYHSPRSGKDRGQRRHNR